MVIEDQAVDRRRSASGFMTMQVNAVGGIAVGHNHVCFLRAKSARVITFEQFSQALTELAPKRFKGKSKEEALQQLYGLIVGKEPANVGITVSI